MRFGFLKERKRALLLGAALAALLLVIAAAVLLIPTCSEEKKDLLSGRYRIWDKAALAGEANTFIILQPAPLGWSGHAEVNGKSMPYFMLTPMSEDKMPPVALQCGSFGVTIFCAMQKGAKVKRFDGYALIADTGYIFGAPHGDLWEAERLK